MRRTSRLTTLALALTLGSVTGLAAQQPPAGPPQGRMGPGMRMGQEMNMMPMGRGMMRGMAVVAAFSPGHLLSRRDALGLTDQQVTQLQALDKQVRDAHQKAMASAKTERDALVAAWKAEQPDATQVRGHAQALMQAMQSAHLAMLGAAAQAKGLLTPEQRGHVEGWLEARRMRAAPRMRGMRGWHRGPGRL